MGATRSRQQGDDHGLQLPLKEKHTDGTAFAHSELGGKTLESWRWVVKKNAEVSRLSLRLLSGKEAKDTAKKTNVASEQLSRCEQ